MRKTCRVVVFGNTLVLAGIQSSIALDRSCETIACDATATLQQLMALCPDVLVFELDTVTGEFLYTLSREIPGLLLIGIDPETNRATFWAGQEAIGFTTYDLTRAIHHTGKTGPLGLLKKAIKFKQDA